MQHGVRGVGGSEHRRGHSQTHLSWGLSPDQSWQEGPGETSATGLRYIPSVFGGAGIYTTGKKSHSNLEVSEKCENQFMKQDNYLLQRKQKAELGRKTS